MILLGQLEWRKIIVPRVAALLVAMACCAARGWGKPATKSTDPLVPFARSCGMSEAIQQSSLIFASPDDLSWHKYATFNDIPEWPTEWQETALIWGGRGSRTLMVVIGVGQDFADYSYYCFTAQGNMVRMRQEFRTAWDWGFEETISYDAKGKEEERSMRYFSTEDEHTIEPPDESDLVPPPKVFHELSSVPFFSMLPATISGGKVKNGKEKMENGEGERR